MATTTLAHAQAGTGGSTPEPAGAQWEFAATVFPTFVRGGETIGAFWFNPGSDEEVVVVSIGTSA